VKLESENCIVIIRKLKLIYDFDLSNRHSYLSLSVWFHPICGMVRGGFLWGGCAGIWKRECRSDKYLSGTGQKSRIDCHVCRYIQRLDSHQFTLSLRFYYCRYTKFCTIC